MTKEEVTQEVGKSILRPLGLLQGLFLIAFLSSPFVWIWYSGMIAFKVGITGFIGAMIMNFLHKITRKVIEDAVDGEWDKINATKNKSKFQQRLEQLAKERNEK